MPRWALPAVGAGALLLLLLLVLRSCTGGSDRSDGGACMSELLGHLPASVDEFAGVDYLAARANGFHDDGSLEDLGDSRREAGVISDPVTMIWRIRRLASAERFESETGVGSGDIVCSVGTEEIAALTGEFDTSKVRGSDAGSSGRLATDGQLLTLSVGSPQAEALLDRAADDGLAGDDAMRGVLEALREMDAHSVIVQRGDGTEKNHRALAAGIGSVGEGEDREVAVAWLFPDEDSANESRPEIAQTLNSVLQGTLSIRSSDLEVDGSSVIASIPTRSAPDLQQIFEDGERLVPEPE